MGIVWAPGLQAFRMMGSRAPATPPPFGGLKDGSVVKVSNLFLKQNKHQKTEDPLIV